jgi:8-oxo-dGTP pyrophosphatase MutT (NUDIX family)
VLSVTDQPPSPSEVVLRPAATVMLVRDAPLGFEVLMVRRNLNSDFVGGAYVFPGGAVDASDSGPEVETRTLGRSDADASAILGVDRGGLAYWVAVLRECFEEAGVLLATDADGTLLSLDGPLASRYVEHRRSLNARERSFVSIVLEEDLQLDVADVHYFAHWITPEGAPRRYDTRFFVAKAPPGQTPAHDAGETIDDVWIRPAEALERHRAGDIELIFPTIRNLQAISRFATADELLAAAASAGTIPAMLPRITVTERGVRILLPGDDGYDDAVTPAATSTPGSFNETIRQISLAANEAPPAS